MPLFFYQTWNTQALGHKIVLKFGMAVIINRYTEELLRICGRTADRRNIPKIFFCRVCLNYSKGPKQIGLKKLVMNTVGSTRKWH